MRCLVFVIVFFIANFAKAQEMDSAISGTRLDSLFIILQNNPNCYENQKKFFKAFPKTFDEFYDTYKYQKQSVNPLYKQAPLHILNGFAKLDKISDSLYYQRLINLSISGFWAADAPNYLQHVLREKVEDNSELVLRLLKNYSNEKVYSFWFFFFHSLHPSEKGIPAYLSKQKGNYPIIYSQILKAFHDADGNAKE